MQINKENYTFFAKNPSRAEFLMEVIYSCFIREGDFVIDVGANRGLHTAPLAQLVGKQGRVFAFEAIPALAKNLQSHFINDQVTVLAGAVTNHKIAAEHKELSFSHVVNLNTRSGILRRQDVKDEWMPETITVPAMTLDDMISPTTLISFIKIDTEGGDFNVLQGGEGILRRSNPFFIFESGRESAASLYNYSKRDFFLFSTILATSFLFLLVSVLLMIYGMLKMCTGSCGDAILLRPCYHFFVIISVSLFQVLFGSISGVHKQQESFHL